MFQDVLFCIYRLHSSKKCKRVGSTGFKLQSERCFHGECNCSLITFAVNIMTICPQITSRKYWYLNQLNVQTQMYLTLSLFRLAKPKVSHYIQILYLLPYIEGAISRGQSTENGKLTGLLVHNSLLSALHSTHYWLHAVLSSVDMPPKREESSRVHEENPHRHGENVQTTHRT